MRLQELQSEPPVRIGNDAPIGPLRIGVVPKLGPYLPHVLNAIRARVPRPGVSLREGPADQLFERLRQGRLDALLLALPVPDADIAVDELFGESFAAALPEGHPLAALRATLAWRRDDSREAALRHLAAPIRAGLARSVPNRPHREKRLDAGGELPDHPGVRRADAGPTWVRSRIRVI